MKKLVIVRHSKSSWSDPYLSDFDRPLNKRGNRDGGLMAEFLSKRINNVDKLLSSSSKRTRLTSEFFKNKINIKVENYTDKLYHASYDDIIGLLNQVKDDVRSLILIGHNPGLTHLVNFFTEVNLYNLPTTGIVVINFMIDKWKKIKDSKGNIEIIKFPKELNS